MHLPTTTRMRNRLGIGNRTAEGPAMTRLRAIAGCQSLDPAGEGLRLARRRALEDAHLAWQRGDTAGEIILRSLADSLGRELNARLLRS